MIGITRGTRSATALLLGLVVAVVAPARRPVRVDAQARPRPQGLRRRCCPATAACSTASTRCCSACRSPTTWPSISRSCESPGSGGPRSGSARSLGAMTTRRRHPRVDRVDRDPGARRHLRRHRDDFRVVALAAGRNAELLERAAGRVRRRRPTSRARALDDPDVLAELAAHPDADVVLNAVVGFAGLPATLAALEAGKRLALANKESLIAGGPGRRQGARRGRRRDRARRLRALRALPGLRAGRRAEVARIVLTASGGPFRGRTRGRARDASPSPTRSRTPRGTWAPRSRSTRRRS